jgi:lysophospholipase L1-like esterase
VTSGKSAIIDYYPSGGALPWRPLTPLDSDDQGCRLGVLAFGDSITNAGGELQWGVAMHSWALWLARSLGVPYTGYAVDGAGIAEVVAEQIPAFCARSSQPDGRYDVGCLYIGVNDVRALDWDPRAYEVGLRTALSFVCARCDRTLALTAPLRLGLPSAGHKVEVLNGIVERVAADLGALLLDLRAFGGRSLVMADRVHPTALGQVAIAERALTVLARDGLTARTAPASLITYTTTWRGRLRADWVYVYRSLKELGRAVRALSRARTDS